MPTKKDKHTRSFMVAGLFGAIVMAAASINIGWNRLSTDSQEMTEDRDSIDSEEIITNLETGENLFLERPTADFQELVALKVEHKELTEKYVSLLGEVSSDRLNENSVPPSPRKCSLVITSTTNVSIASQPVEYSIEQNEFDMKMLTTTVDENDPPIHSHRPYDGESRKFHPLKPRRKGYMRVIQSSMIDGTDESKHYFCLDGLPSQTNLDQSEPASMKDRSFDHLVPALFFFEDEDRYQEFHWCFGGVRRRSPEFQKEFARVVKGMVFLNDKKVGWDEQGSFDKEMMNLFEGTKVFVIGNDEVHEFECETMEQRNRWLTGLVKMIRAYQKSN